MTKKRVLLAAGGTGGHFYPGLVLARALRERGWTPVLLTRKADPALAQLESEGLTAVAVDLTGLPRSLGPELLGFTWRLAKAVRLVDRVVKDLQPRVVIGMGSYLTFPAVLSACRRSIPRAVHESNSVLGLANRLCLPLGAKLFWGLPAQEPGRGELVGTPIRPELWSQKDPKGSRRSFGLDPELATILIFGGSQGAKGLNEQVPLALKGPSGLQVLHLAGNKDEAAVTAAYRQAGIRAAVLAYCEDMSLAYAAADLVICRSGAGTLAELFAQRKPAVLIPFPHAAAGHQEANARVLEKSGAALVVLESELPARLGALAADLLSSEARRRGMSQAYELLGLPAPARVAASLADAVETLSRT